MIHAIQKLLLIIGLALLCSAAAHAQGPVVASRVVSSSHANLGTPINGSVRYCSDCQATNPATSGGSGAFCRRVAGAWDCSVSVTDHGALTGLSDDDHTQYARLAGRAGGQTLAGGTAASENLTLQSTTHATKGYILLGTGGLVGVNKSTPGAQAHIQAATSSTKGLIVQGAASQSANIVEVQDSAGAALSYFAASGNINAPRLLSTTNGSESSPFVAGSAGRGFYEGVSGLVASVSGVGRVLLAGDQYGLLIDGNRLIGFNSGGSVQAIQSGDVSLSRSAAGIIQVGDGSANANGKLRAAQVSLGGTITASGTTGAQTINKALFAVNFAAAATSLTVTNSLVTTSSVVICTVQTNDTTLKSVAAVPASGSVTLYANAAPTAETRVACEVKGVL